ncbi:MAG: OmpA family protein [Endomicrobia bacterium]|nr:OmpA family protein [Endomicrobiia bacterium]MCL2798719.1 OmpA family protein [Endomicrobiia bacterium]
MNKIILLSCLFAFVLFAGSCAKNKIHSTRDTDIIKGTINKDGKIVIKDIKFEKDSDKISKSSEEPIKKIATYLKNNTEVTMNVACYNENDGTPSYCIDLSKQRAAALTDKLKNHGIDDFRINYKPVDWKPGVVSEEPDESIEVELVH